MESCTARPRSVVVYLLLVLGSCLPALGAELPRRIASLELPGTAPIRSMAVDGDMVLLGMAAGDDAELLAVDASDPTTPHLAWSMEIGGDVNGIALIGQHAFLATSLDDAELLVVDLPTR